MIKRMQEVCLKVRKCILVMNTKIAWNVLHKEKPDLIISCGAAVAVPFFYIGKMMGAKLVYIEVFDRIDKPTMTGKMVYPIVDKFVVQWKEQKNVYSTNRIDVASSKRTCFAH